MKGDGKHAAREVPYNVHDVDKLDARPLYPQGDEYVQELIAVAVDSLPERERFVFERHEYERLSYNEIAGLMSLSKTQVQNIHRAACARLASALRPQLERQDD